jgi:hypothetical protein
MGTLPVQRSISCFSLVPKNLVPVQALVVGQIVFIKIERGVEDQLRTSCGRVSILGPVDLVARPHGVRVASQNK